MRLEFHRRFSRLLSVFLNTSNGSNCFASGLAVALHKRRFAFLGGLVATRLVSFFLFAPSLWEYQNVQQGVNVGLNANVMRVKFVETIPVDIQCVLKSPLN